MTTIDTTDTADATMTAEKPAKAPRPRKASPHSLLDELADETPALLERLDAPAPADLPMPVLPLSDIAPDPQQPRRHIRQETLEVLAADIERVGVLQPLVVRPAADWNGYILVFGERRYRAAQMAGLTHVPAVVRRDLDDADVLDLQWQENARREDIDDIDKALHLRRMKEVKGLSWTQLADEVRLTRRHLMRMQQLAEMPPFVTALVRERRLTPSHVYQLARITDPARQEALARSAVAGGWSVSRLNREIQYAGPGSAPDPSFAVASSASLVRETRQDGQESNGTESMSPAFSHDEPSLGGDLSLLKDSLRRRLSLPLTAMERAQVAEIVMLASSALAAVPITA